MMNDIERMNQRILLTDKKNYKRELYQSYMTGPEWRNVEMVAEYGKFLHEKHSMFQFVYFSQIAELWKVMYHSYVSARRHHGITEILFSEYMLMDVFVVFFTTIELLPKGILSLLLYPFLQAQNDTAMQKSIADFYVTYANRLETTPFFDHNYWDYRSALGHQFSACDNKSWIDWLSWIVIYIELTAKGLLSIPLYYMMHQDPDEAVITTDILVKCEINDAEPANKFKEKLAKINKSADEVKLIGDISIIASNCYARLRVPRYRAFLPLVKIMAEEMIHIQKIAGQDLVQVKCNSNVEAMEQWKEALHTITGINPLYTYGDSIHPDYIVCLFEVSVENLHSKLDQLEQADTSGAAKVNFIHNF